MSRSPARASPILPGFSSEVDPSSVVTKFIRVGNETLAAQKGGDKFFYHNDHLGGVNVVTDITGNRVQLYEYDSCERVSERGERIGLTHAFCFSGLASDIRGLTPLKRFESCFQDLQESAGDFSNDLHNDFSLSAPTILYALIYTLKVKSLAAGSKTRDCFDTYNKVIRVRIWFDVSGKSQ